MQIAVDCAARCSHSREGGNRRALGNAPLADGIPVFAGLVNVSYGATFPAAPRSLNRSVLFQVRGFAVRPALDILSLCSRAARHPVLTLLSPLLHCENIGAF